MTSLRRHNFEQHIEDEDMWLENTRSVLKDDVEPCENTSWAAYHARHQDPKQPVITPTSLLPLFQFPCLADARKAAETAASARRLHCNALVCVSVKANASRLGQITC